MGYPGMEKGQRIYFSPATSIPLCRGIITLSIRMLAAKGKPLLPKKHFFAILQRKRRLALCKKRKLDQPKAKPKVWVSGGNQKKKPNARLELAALRLFNGSKSLTLYLI